MICTLLSLSIIIFLLSSSSGDGNSLTINYKHFLKNKKLTNSPLNTVFLSERELPILVFAIYKDTWLGRQSSVQLSDTLTMRLMGIDSFRVNRPCLLFQPIRPNWLLVDLFYSQFICISNVRNNTIRISTLSICFYFLRKTNHRIGIINYVLFQEMEMSFFWHYLDCKLDFFFLKKKSVISFY
jgi:hypothetical protein